MQKLLEKNYFSEERGFLLMEMSVPAGQTGICHNHEFYEIEIMLEGESRDHINGRWYSLHAGQFVLLRPEDAHGVYAEKKHGFRLLNLAVSAKIIHEIFTFLGIDPSGWEEPLIGELSQEDMLRLKPLSKALMPAVGSVREKILLKEWIVSLLFQHHLQTKEAENESMPLWLKNLAEEMKKPECLAEGTAYLKQHSNMSYSHVCRCFKKYFSKTPVEWVNEQRILQSSKMLLNTQMSVLDIAYECGFQNISHFNHTFKAFYGLSPSGFRNIGKHIYQ